MPDTFTPILALTKPQVGSSVDTWGPKYHSAMDAIDALFTDPTNKILKLEHGGTGGNTQASARAAMGLGALSTLSMIDTSRISDAAVTTDKLNNSAVTTGKIADGAVTESKLAAGVGFPSGTRLLFQQSTAPVGWTKDTTHNDKALRVVSGNVATGGYMAFSTAFSARSLSGSSDTQAVSGTVLGHALTEAQIPAHTHTINTGPSAGSGKLGYSGGGSGTITSSAIGGGQTHTHGFTGSSHAHTVSVACDMNVSYVDVIIAVKN